MATKKATKRMKKGKKLSRGRKQERVTLQWRVRGGGHPRIGILL